MLAQILWNFTNRKTLIKILSLLNTDFYLRYFFSSNSVNKEVINQIIYILFLWFESRGGLG
jgi:hypothetical protein